MPNETFVKSTTGYNAYGGRQGPAPKVPDVLLCENCGCQYLEERRIARFNAEATTIVGNSVPPIGGGVLFLYVCINCGFPVDQPMHFMGDDADRVQHNEIISILKGEHPAQQEE